MNQEPTKNEELETLKEYLEPYLIKFTNYYNPSRKYANKFLCISHNEERPSMSLEPNKKYIHCFSCNATYSLIDLIIKDYELGDLSQPLEERLKDKEAIKKACNKIKELFNLGDSGTVLKNIEYKPQEKKEDLEELAKKGVYGAPARDYLKSRALTNEELNKTLGLKNYYDATGRGILAIPYQIKGELETLTERVISLGIGKDIKDLPKELRYKHHGKMKTYDPFNYLEANTERAIIITEGELDTISFYTVLSEIKKENNITLNVGSIALGGINNNKDLINRLDNLPAKEKIYFILALDNDTRGELAQRNLKQVLEEKSFNYTMFNYRTFKDANESLLNNKEAFKSDLIDIIVNIKDLCKRASIEHLEALNEEIKQEKENYINKNSALGYLNEFNKYRENPIKPNRTFFNALDNLLNGGIREGLITIGAVSSLGKTSFILQLADQIAQSRQKDILYISLEMSLNELIAKSINRDMYLLCKNKTQNVKNQTEILSSNFNNWNQEQKLLFNEALESYKSYADHLFIKEGVGSYGVKEIEEAIEEHKRNTNKTPIVIIDYLQILSTPDSHLTDKQKIDTNILALKRLSREEKTPIIVVSSLNRASYSQEVSLASFKESGAIEYTSDIILGLNYNLTEEELNELKGIRRGNRELPEEEKNKIIEDFYKKVRANNPRNIKLTVLKNRIGEKDKDLLYYFYPRYNFFTEQAQSIELYKELLEHSRSKTQEEFIELPF